METLHPNLYDAYLTELGNIGSKIIGSEDQAQREAMAADAENWARQHWGPRGVPARSIRFLLTTLKTTEHGGQYRRIHFVGEYNPANWKSEQHMRRSFRDKAKRQWPEAWNDPTREICREEVLI